MLKTLIALLLLSVGCSPTYWAVTKKCPTTTLVVSDVLLSIAVGAVAGLHWGNHPGRATAEGLVAAGIWGGAHVAEARCAR